MDALRKSIGGTDAETKATKKPAKKSKKTSPGKEMLMPIAGKKQAKEPAVKKPAPKRKFSLTSVVRLLRRALRASVADGVQDVANFRCRGVR